MKNRKLYHTITSITVFGPLILLLIYFFAMSNQGVKEILEAPKVDFPSAPKNYDYILDTNNYIDVEIIEEEIKIVFHADVMIFDDLEILNGTIKLDNPDFFMIGKEAFSYDKETNAIVEYNLLKPIQDHLIKTSFSIGFVLVIAIGSAVVILYMVFKKMKFGEEHRRLSVLMFAWVLAFLFLFLALITNAIATTFLVFAISWTLYYIEWAIDRKKRGLTLNDGIAKRVSVIKDGE